MFGNGTPPAATVIVEYFPPGPTFIVRATSHINTSISGTLIQSFGKRAAQATSSMPDPKTFWRGFFARGGVDSGMVVATADFLFEAGEFEHVAEFLDANLDSGVVVRPWVYEALALAREAGDGDPKEVLRLQDMAAYLRKTSEGDAEPHPDRRTLLRLQGFHILSERNGTNGQTFLGVAGASGGGGHPAGPAVMSKTINGMLTLKSGSSGSYPG
jgi:hypothetical protein